MPTLPQLADKVSQYVRLTNELAAELGTKNIIGQWGEELIAAHLDGQLLKASNKGADVEAFGVLYQVKTRQVNPGDKRPQLGTIRSWDFDYLAVVLIDHTGGVKAAYFIPAETARPLAYYSEHVNGHILYITPALVARPDCQDITEHVRNLTRHGTIKF